MFLRLPHPQREGLWYKFCYKTCCRWLFYLAALCSLKLPQREIQTSFFLGRGLLQFRIEPCDNVDIHSYGTVGVESQERWRNHRATSWNLAWQWYYYTGTNCSSRAFSVAAPSIWTALYWRTNGQADGHCDLHTFALFTNYQPWNSQLNSHLFQSAFVL